jgi:serine protease inhibitor
MTVRRGTATIVATILATGLLLGGCAAAAPPGDAERVDPDLVAGLSAGDARVVAEAVNRFGFDLLDEVTDGTGNAVTSPLSVAVLLAMVLAGAGGDTAEAMARVLHLDDPRDVRLGALLGQLGGTDDVTLSVANALWAQPGVPLEDDYLAFVRDTFGATVDNADLGDRDTADEIDAWVTDRTGGLIDGIAEDLGLPSGALLVLVNAVYFLGEWSTRFDRSDTVDAPFTLADGEQVRVPTMRIDDSEFGYAERPGYRMLRLPYGDDGRFAMEVLLPDAHSNLARLLDRLDADEWREATEALFERTVTELALPRFELEWQAELNDPLTALGMGGAFGPGADFRPMSPADPWLGTVVHKTFLRVDEDGTEAAAVTGADMQLSGPARLEFRVDRPFAFTISDTNTGTVLFLGAVADPRG